MKKNIEWLKEEINIERKLLCESLVGAKETTVERVFNDGKEHGLIFASNRINQLDEPEVLSQELPVIPKFVAYVIETYKSNSRLTNLLADLAFHGELAEFVEHEDEDEVFEWARSNRKATDEILARAWLDGFTVEKERKYLVELPNPNNQMGRHKNVFLNKKDGKVFIDSASLFVNDITKYEQFALTEEEIKKDFEWAWKFAKPVEEME